MDIETQIKTELKTQRLNQLKRRYFELELDRVGLEANGDINGVEAIVKRMDTVQRAYDAVNAIDTGE